MAKSKRLKKKYALESTVAKLVTSNVLLHNTLMSQNRTITEVEDALRRHDNTISDIQALAATNTKTINEKFSEQDDVNQKVTTRLTKLEHKKSFFRR